MKNNHNPDMVYCGVTHSTTMLETLRPKVKPDYALRQLFRSQAHPKHLSTKPSAMSTGAPCVVMVDPYSTGALLAQELDQRSTQTEGITVDGQSPPFARPYHYQISVVEINHQRKFRKKLPSYERFDCLNNDTSIITSLQPYNTSIITSLQQYNTSINTSLNHCITINT